MRQPCNTPNHDGTFCLYPAESCPLHARSRGTMPKAQLYVILATVAVIGLGFALIGIVKGAPAISHALSHGHAATRSAQTAFPSATTRDRIAPPETRTVTSTVTRTSTAEPPGGPSRARWQGAWLRGYAQSPGDCSQVNNFYVVQPSDEDGLYMLLDGCFARTTASDIDDHCTSVFRGKVDGYCAVWDPGLTLSSPNRTGDLEVVALTQACLDRARLPAYSTQHPIHADCVVFPNS